MSEIRWNDIPGLPTKPFQIKRNSYTFNIGSESLLKLITPFIGTERHSLNARGYYIDDYEVFATTYYTLIHLVNNATGSDIIQTTSIPPQFVGATLTDTDPLLNYKEAIPDIAKSTPYVLNINTMKHYIDILLQFNIIDPYGDELILRFDKKLVGVNYKYLITVLSTIAQLGYDTVNVYCDITDIKKPIVFVPSLPSNVLNNINTVNYMVLAKKILARSTQGTPDLYTDVVYDMGSNQVYRSSDKSLCSILDKTGAIMNASIDDFFSL